MQDSQLIGGERPLRRRERWCLVLGIVGVLALVNAAPGLAGTVDFAGGGSTLQYVAGAGEANNVTVNLTSGNYVIGDSGAPVVLAPGAASCTATANEATCPAAGVTALKLDLGNGIDTATITAATSALVLARDGTADTINCVAGQTVAADGADTVNGCAADRPPDTVIVSGPSGKTADATPSFQVDSPDADAAGFECRIDGGAFGSCDPGTLADGSHTFEARAFDDFGADPTPAVLTFEVDTTGPDTVVNSAPAGTHDSRTARFEFFSDATDFASFECNLDGSGWQACSTPETYSGLSEGSHSWSVRALDDVGNRGTEATINFRVVLAASIIAPNPANLIITRPPASFVLIGGSTIKASRRIATVSLNCSGNRDCAGDLTLTTAKRIRLKRKRPRHFVRLGGASFFIPAPRTVKVKVPMSKRSFRIVKKLRRLKTMVIVRDRDRVGRARVSTREVSLKAR
jgi:hypothetical protein